MSSQVMHVFLSLCFVLFPVNDEERETQREQHSDKISAGGWHVKERQREGQVMHQGKKEISDSRGALFNYVFSVEC